jgi:hypothetical protein
MGEISTVIPCVVFGFNRPDFLKKTLDSLRYQGLDRLIVFIDGPSNNKEEVMVQQSKQIARSVDWTETELVFKEKNNGLIGITDNISEVFTRYQSAVFIEDDCLPMPGFYSFMCQSLRHYEREKQVFSIGSYQLLEENFFKEYIYSVVSSPRFMCWGWATWKDRWNLVHSYNQTYKTLFNNLTQVPGYAGCDIPTTARACAIGLEKTWDTPVALTTLWLEKVHILPVRGLTRNLGTSGTGTHDGTQTDYFHNRNVWEQPLENIVWLNDISINWDYANEIVRLLDTIFPHNNYSFLRKILRKIKRIFIS